jgi:hypothetical protein
MSAINVFHEIKIKSIKKGKKTVSEESVIEGEKGLLIKYFSKDDKGEEKIVISGKDGNYKMRTKVDGVKDEKDLDEDGLKKELKVAKLKFAKDLLKGGSKKADADLAGGAKKRSGSKKSGSKKSGSKKSGSKKSGSKKSGSKK